jgi:hypothetical protein
VREVDEFQDRQTSHSSGVACRTDFALDGVRHCYAKLSSCHAKAGVPERFRDRRYDAPHEFNAAMQREAWDWLARWL